MSVVVERAALLRPDTIEVMRRRYIDVSDYVPTVDTDDPENDCWAGIQAAFAEGDGREVVFTNPIIGTPRVYRCLNRALGGLLMPTSGRVIFEAPVDFSAYDIDGDSDNFLQTLGSVDAGVALPSNVAPGDAQIPVAVDTGANYPNGSLLYITDDEPYSPHSPTVQRGEFARVLSRTGDTLTLYKAIQGTYTTAENAKIYLVTPTTLRIDNPLLIGPGRFTSDTGDRGLMIRWGDGVRVTGGVIQRCDAHNLYVSNAVNVIVDGLASYQSYADPLGAISYGITFANALEDVLLRDCWAVGGKHGLVQSSSGDGVVGGETRHFTISGGGVRGTSHAGIATHMTGCLFTVKNRPLIENCAMGWDCRVQDVDVDGLTVRNLTGGTDGVLAHAIHLRGRVGRCNIRGVKVETARFGFRLSETESTEIEEGIERISFTDFDITNTYQAMELYNENDTARGGLTIERGRIETTVGHAIEVYGRWNQPVLNDITLVDGPGSFRSVWLHAAGFGEGAIDPVVTNIRYDDGYTYPLIQYHDGNMAVTHGNRRLGGEASSSMGIPIETKSATLTDDLSQMVIPAGWRILSIFMANSTANAVTGGVKIGTTSGGTEVVVAQAVGANADLEIDPANVLIKYFPTETTLYVRPVTAINGASVNVSIVLIRPRPV